MATNKARSSSGIGAAAVSDSPSKAAKQHLLPPNVSSSSTSTSSSSSGSTSSTRLTKSTRSYSVVGAIHPVTKARLSLAEALECGVLNREQGTYCNLASGEQTKLAEAIQQGLVLTEPTADGSAASAFSATAPAASELVTLREATYNVIGVLHPRTRERLTVARAVELGILDPAAGIYRSGGGGGGGLAAGAAAAQMSVAEAIDKGLVLVDQGSERSRRDPKKVTSIHIEEEEQETLTVVEETLTETKKWIITSVVDPRTRQRMSYDDAVLSGVLDQTAGVYRNPDTGETTPIAKAIETGLIEGELVSVNLSGDEFHSYSASGLPPSAVESVRDVRTERWLTVDEAVRVGLVDAARQRYVDPVTGKAMSLSQAVESGLARTKATAALAAAQRLPQGGSSSSSLGSTVPPAAQPENGMRAAREELAARGRSFGSGQALPPVNGSGDDAPDDVRSRARNVLDRARLYTEQSSISQTERKLTGYTTDWARERVYELSTGQEMTFDEAIELGVIDANKVAVMRKFKEQQEKAKAMAAEASSPARGGGVPPRTATLPGDSAVPIAPTTIVSTTAPLVLSPAAGPRSTSPAPAAATSPNSYKKLAVVGTSPGSSVALQHGGTGSGVSEYRKIAVSKTIVDQPMPESGDGSGLDRVSMTLHLPVQSMAGGGLEPRIGPLPYEVAVKLGLFNVKTGRYRDPVSEASLSFQDATAWGHLHPNGAAFTNLNTGQPLTLDEAVRQSLIDPDSGRPLEGRLRQLNIAVPDAFAVSRFIAPPPLNLEDAVKVGLLNAVTAVLTHPQSADETRSLGEAVHMRLVDGKSAVVWHPGVGGTNSSSGAGNGPRKYYVDEALRQRLLDPDTGDLIDPKTGSKIMSFFDALKNHHIESTYDPVHLTVIDPNSGIRVDVAQAVKRGLLGPDTCLVYDTEQGRQVSFDEALTRDIVDRQAGVYKDKRGVRNLVLATAFEMGLVEPVGAPLLHRVKMVDALSRLYPAAPVSSPATPSGMLSPSSSHATVRLQVLPSQQPPTIFSSTEYSQESENRTLVYSQSSASTPPSGRQGRAQQPERLQDRSLPQEKRALTPVEEEPVNAARQAPRVSQAPLSKVLEADRWRPQADDYLDSLAAACATPSEAPAGAHKGNRPSADGISDTEYFVKGGESMSNGLLSNDDHPIDHFVPTVSTPCPKSVQWDIALVKPSPAAATVKRTVTEEETVRNVMKKANKMQVHVEAKAKPTSSNLTPPDFATATVTTPTRSTSEAGPLDRSSRPALQRDGSQQQPVQQQPQQRIKDKEIIIIDRQGPSVTRNVNIEQLTIDSAVERGLVSCEPGSGGSWQYTDPTTGERMPLAEAVRRGYVRGSIDEARRALEINAKRSGGGNHNGGSNAGDRDTFEYTTVQEYSSAVEKLPSGAAGMPFADAVDSGQLDTRTGTFRSSASSEACSLKEAIDRGLIDGLSAEFVNPGSKRVYSLRDALEQRALDGDGRWTSPATGTKKSLDEAIKKGYLALTVSEQTVNRITTVKETKRVAVENVVHPVTRQYIGLQAALREDIIQPSRGLYQNPATSDSLPLDEALRSGLVRGRIVDSRRTTEERIVDSTSIVSRRNESVDQPDGQKFTSVVKVVQSPTKTFAIVSVTDPSTNRPLTATEAIDRKIIDLGQALYTNTITGEVITFEEAIRRKLIRCVETTDLPTEDRFNITGVVDPRTGLQISLADAIADGIIDFEKGLYVNIVTGNSVPIETAVRRRLIVADGKVPEDLTQQAASTDEEVVDSVFVQTRAYSITHAIDPRTQEKIGINEALRRGLLDDSLAVFHDLQAGVDMPVQDAIDKGLLVVSESEPSKSKANADDSKVIQKSSVYSVEKVVDPKTREEITPKEAVARGVIDEVTGDYVNVDTMENWSMERAIREGVVKARPPVAAAAGGGAPPMPASETVSFSIEAVVDPKTGDQMSVSDALRHGFLGRGRQTFINPHTGETLSIQEAVHRGWIKLKTNFEKGRSSLARPSRSGMTLSRTQPQQQQQSLSAMAIRSVIDPRTGEELSVSQAVRHGVLDRSGRSFHNTATGETIAVEVAVQRGLIKLAAASGSRGVGGEPERGADGLDVTVREAIRRGLVNSRTGKYIHPTSGQVMPVDEAVRRGYLLREEVTREEAPVQTAAGGSNSGGDSRQPAGGATAQPPGAVGTWRVPYTLQRRSPSPNRSASASARRRPVATGANDTPAGPAFSAGIASRAPEIATLPQPMDVLSAAHQGMIDVNSGSFVHSLTGQHLTVDEALIQGLLTTQAPIVPTLFRPRGPNPLSVAEAFQRGLVNPLSLDVLNTHTGQWMTFDEALTTGYVQPRLPMVGGGAGITGPSAAAASSGQARTATLEREAAGAAAATTAATMARTRAESLPRQLVPAAAIAEVGQPQQQIRSHHTWQAHEVVTWQQTPGGMPPQAPPAVGQLHGVGLPQRLPLMADETPRLPVPPLLAAVPPPPLQPPPLAGVSRQETLSRMQQQQIGSQPGTFQRGVAQQQSISYQQQQQPAPSSPLMHGRQQRITGGGGSSESTQQAGTMTAGRRANSVPRTMPGELQQQQQRTADTLRRPSGTVLSPMANSTAHFVNGRLYAVRPGYFIDASGEVIHSASGAHTTISQALSGDIVQLLPDEDEEEAAARGMATFGRHGTLASTFADKASIPWDRGFTLERFMGEPVLPPPLPPPLLPPLAPPPPLATMPTPLPVFGSLGRPTLPDMAAQYSFNDTRQVFSERTPANTFV